MRIGAFELEDQLPKLERPYAFAVLRPWIDVGRAGSLALSTLEKTFHARWLGQLSTPGSFYDFTRYRPILRFVEGEREVVVPNTQVTYATRPEGNDLIFFNLMEPHMLGEAFVDSMFKVMGRLGVEWYCLVGGMYDAVPHTKPLIASGFGSGEAEARLRRAGVRPSDYEGPATVVTLLTQDGPKHGIDSMVLVVHLPQYTQLNEDYAGQLRLLEAVASVFDLPLELDGLRRRATEQYTRLNSAVEREPQLKEVVRQLEEYYDARASRTQEQPPELSPEVQSFLHEINERFGRS
ncbi:MAG: PAC2 family protein [Chloroflexota bacterium]